MTDHNLEFLQKFVNLYQELIKHDGYGDMAVKIRLIQGRKKEVRLLCGREYRFRVTIPSDKNKWGKYRVVASEDTRRRYAGPERRSGNRRRNFTRPRRQKDVPRNFKLERRITPDRRSGRGRRYDD